MTGVVRGVLAARCQAVSAPRPASPATMRADAAALLGGLLFARLVTTDFALRRLADLGFLMLVALAVCLRHFWAVTIRLALERQPPSVRRPVLAWPRRARPDLLEPAAAALSVVVTDGFLVLFDLMLGHPVAPRVPPLAGVLTISMIVAVRCVARAPRVPSGPAGAGSRLGVGGVVFAAALGSTPRRGRGGLDPDRSDQPDQPNRAKRPDRARHQSGALDPHSSDRPTGADHLNTASLNTANLNTANQDRAKQADRARPPKLAATGAPARADNRRGRPASLRPDPAPDRPAGPPPAAPSPVLTAHPELAPLVHRPRPSLDPARIEDYLRDETILVTGAGGTIGAALCRRLREWGVGQLIMLDRDATALRAIDTEITGDPSLSDDAHLVDIRDHATLVAVLRATRPRVVFHAAACGRLAPLERFPGESVRTNIWGTLSTLEAAADAGVERFVNVSADVAANPTGVLGCSERINERLTAHVARRVEGVYFSVRLGNVLDGVGTVIQTFERQLARGEPLTVTHPGAARFFVTAADAADAVIAAGALGSGGEVLVVDHGDPVSIAEIAGLFARRHRPPAEVVYIGLDDGEKLVSDQFDAAELDVYLVDPVISHAAVPPLHPAEVAALNPRADPAELRADLLRLGRREDLSAGVPRQPGPRGAEPDEPGSAEPAHDEPAHDEPVDDRQVDDGQVDDGPAQDEPGLQTARESAGSRPASGTG